MSEHASSPDEVFDLVERVAKLEAAVEDEKRSFARRFGLWGGLLALVISILAGAIGIYDRVQAELDKDEALVAQASAVAERLNAISAEYTKLQAGGDREALFRWSMVANTEIAGLLDKFRRFPQKIAERLSSADLITAAYHLLSQGFQADALTLIDAAAANATNAVMRAEAHKQRAMALFVEGDRQDLALGRQEFQRAIDLAQATQANRLAVLSGIYLNWIAFEAGLPDCAAAQALLDRFRAELSVLPPSHALWTGVQFLVRDLHEQTRCEPT